MKRTHFDCRPRLVLFSNRKIGVEIQALLGVKVASFILGLAPVNSCSMKINAAKLRRRRFLSPLPSRARKW